MNVLSIAISIRDVSEGFVVAAALPNVATGLIARPGRRRRHHRQPRHTPTLEPRFRRWRHALRRQLRSCPRIAPQRARVFATTGLMVSFVLMMVLGTALV